MSLSVSIINGKAPSGGVGGVSDADFSGTVVDFFTSGCVGTNDFAVQQQATPNKTVLVKAGTYYVPNATSTMYYRVVLSSDQSVTISDNANANPRITSVVLKVDLGATPNNLASNVATLVTVDGAPAASPTTPTNSDIQTAVGSGNVYARLADVTANSNFTTITTSNIADKRFAAWMKTTGTVQTGSIQDGAVTGTKMNVASATNAITSPYVTATPILATGHQETGQATATGWGGTSPATVRFWVPFKCVMTNTPSSVTLSSPSYNNCNSLSLNDVSKYGFRVTLTTTVSNAQWDCGFTYATVGN